MTAAYLLAAAAAIPADDTALWSASDVRDLLAKLATDLEPPETIETQAAERMPLTGPHLAEAIGRYLFRESPDVVSDYGRCVQVSQMLGNAANHLDVKEDHARADLLREYAHAVSIAGGAL